MASRLQPFHRIGVLFWTYGEAIVLQIFLVPLSILWMLIDMVLIVVTGGDGLDTGGWLPSMAKETFMWALSNQRYAVFGDGSFTWTPSM